MPDGPILKLFAAHAGTVCEAETTLKAGVPETRLNHTRRSFRISSLDRFQLDSELSKLAEGTSVWAM
jgi:hypothetical protein